MPKTLSYKERAAQIADRLAKTAPDDRKWRDAVPLRRVRDAQQAREKAETKLRSEVDAARAAGFSWTAIAMMLGVTRQAAQQKYGS